MGGKKSRAIAPFVAACLALGGCMVTSSKYEMKAREADTLRDAFATTSKEKNVLESRTDALSRQLADEKESAASLSARVRSQEEEIRRLGEELSVARKSYEGTRITREQFITELLEKEKATGKRIQELGEKAQECDLSVGALRKEAAAREAELAALRKEVSKPGDGETVKRERDILAGRVERLLEERRLEEKRRDERFAALGVSVGKISSEVVLTPLGPALLLHLPDRILLAKSRSTLSDAGKEIVLAAGTAASEFPGSSMVVYGGTKKVAEELRGVLLDGTKIPPERIYLSAGGREKGVDLMLLVP